MSDMWLQPTSRSPLWTPIMASAVRNGVPLPDWDADKEHEAMTVQCPTHGTVKACKDVENGGCSVCSDEFHRELLNDRDIPSECWPYVE